MVLEDLYQDVILDHFKHPRCRGKLTSPSASFSLFNPLCGDQVEINLKVDGNTVRELVFSGHGCAVSQAAASMLTERCSGRSCEEAKAILKEYKGMMTGEPSTQSKSEQSEGLLGDTVALEGVRRFPARIRCALLACEAIEKCLEAVEQK